MTSANLLFEEWKEERLRYHVLNAVYEMAGARCEITVAGPQIGLAVNIGYMDVSRITQWLERRGYLADLGMGPRFCITPKGIEYLEALAGRRQSIRG